MSQNVKAILTAVAILAFLAFAQKKCTRSHVDSAPQIDRSENPATVEVPKDPYLHLGERVNEFTDEAYLETAKGALLAVQDINEIRWLIQGAIADSVYSGQAKKWRVQMVQKQVKYFPVFRKRWAKAAAADLWEHDAEANISGKGGTAITFTSAHFAANKNIATIHANIKSTLEDLRFKEAGYKWYSGDDEYSYYTLKSLKDSDL